MINVNVLWYLIVLLFYKKYLPLNKVNDAINVKFSNSILYARVCFANVY